MNPSGSCERANISNSISSKCFPYSDKNSPECLKHIYNRNFSLLCLTNVCTIALNFHLPIFSDWKNVPLQILKFSQFLATQFSSKPLSRRIIHDRGSNLAARGNPEWLQLDVIGRCTLAQQEQQKEMSKSLPWYIKATNIQINSQGFCNFIMI